MYGCAKLLKKNQNKYIYSFGASENKLDGQFTVDIININDSIIEKESARLSYNNAMRIMVAVIRKMKKDNIVPNFLECATG